MQKRFSRDRAQATAEAEGICVFATKIIAIMSSWSDALNLRERLALLRGNQHLLSQVDRELAERRFKRWQAEKVFAENSSLFAERLADGVTEAELRSVLGILNSDLSNLQKAPEWSKNFAAAIQNQSAWEKIALVIAESPDLGKSAGFLRAAAGFLLHALEKFRAGLARICATAKELPFDPKSIETIFFQSALARVLALLNRTLVLELNVARVQEQLAGETPEQRFESFIARLGQPEVVSALWEEYPVLARQIVVALDQWIEASLEFPERLVEDWKEIRSYFFPADPGVIVKLKSAGDRHQSGRSVHIAEFSSGGKLVYKPRSLQLDQHFQELLGWINAQNPELQFRLLKLLPRSGYGWIEYVDSFPCENQEEIKQFYWRQGGLLALLYALHATDFHFENLVACGAFPVLVDLETLLQPRLHLPPEQDAGFAAQLEIMGSVFRTGLLPFRFAVNEEQQEGAEISGLGGAAGQMTPYPVLASEAAATDAMRFIRRRIEIPSQRNRPRLRDQEISALHYSEDITQGFSSIYRLLENHRAELLSPEGPLVSFAHDQVRCILRPTSAYSTLLTESYHPNLLRDALDRDRFFDNLWADTEFNVLLKRVIEQEREDLWASDIPVFTTFPDSGCLFDSRNRVVEGHQHEPSFPLMQQRLRELGTQDLNRQVWFIRAAMTALSIEESVQITSTAPASLPEGPAGTKDLLEVAMAIGDHLRQSAIPGGQDQDEVAWIGLDMVKEPFWELNVAGSGLYGGLSGIGLFLAYLAEVSGEERFHSLARRVTTTIVRGLKVPADPAKTPIGAFSGMGGIIYFLSHCSVLWNDQALLAKAEELALSLAAAIPEDKSYDVIGGAAGLIPVLLSQNHLRPSDRMREMAVQCGEHLVQNAVACPNGIGWITMADSQPLTGFAHGTAGIAWALARLAAASGQSQFLETAAMALNYERSLFSPEHKNWPDLRDFVRKSKGESYAGAWCHGAPGVGLGRTAMLDQYEDPAIHGEISVALEAAYNRRFSGSHCLCHGGLGNFETVLEAEKKLPEPWLKDALRKYPAEILASLREHGWRCGVPLGVDTPGLMVGTAGIGYGLLRLAYPKRIPSVLLLAPSARPAGFI